MPRMPEAYTDIKCVIDQQEAEAPIPQILPEEAVAKLDWEAALPLDAFLSHGRLDSGLTYYVKPNSVPMNRVLLRLVVKVGSVHEQAHERGFCHLIEHLLFRHTESFKDNDIQRFLSSLGARPGADSNATTYHDYTVFNLMIPVDERTIDYGFGHVDMGIKVLAEMAMRAQFTESILEQERRIVLEESRLNQTNIAQRNAQASKAALLETPYYDKAPIGNINTLKDCRIEQLVAFYHKWYQPKNMAVIAVGGFRDASIVTDLIKNHFSRTPSHITTSSPAFDLRPELAKLQLKTIAPASFVDFGLSSWTPPASPVGTRRVYHEAPESLRDSAPPHAGLKFSLTRNRDDSQSHVVLMFRYLENPLVGSLAEIKAHLTIHILSWLLNSRANLLVNAYLGRMVDLVASESRLTSTIRVFEIGFSCAIGCELETLAKVIMEIERLKRFLIAEEDLEQLKSLALDLSHREASLRKDGLASDSASEKIVKHYLHNEPFEDPNWSAAIMARIIQSWTTRHIQHAACEILDLSSAVLFVSLPENDRALGRERAARSASNPPASPRSSPTVSSSPSSPPSSSSMLPLAEEIPLKRPELTESDYNEVISRVERMELDPIYYYKMPRIMNPENIPSEPGRIVSETKRGSSMIYTLDNGARIQLTSLPPMDQRNSFGVDLELNAEGGLAEIWATEGLNAFYSAMVSSAFAKYVSLGGVPMGSSPVELGVVLVEMQSFLFERRARFSCLPTRIETLMQLIHCLFTQHPAPWPEEFCQQELELMLEYARTARSPEAKLRERAITLCWQQNALLKPLGEAELSKVNIEAARRGFETAWSNPAEFLFHFTGDFSTPEQQQNAISLISRYIGSIPARLEEEYTGEARASRIVKANSKVAKSVRFRNGIKKDVLYEADDGSGHVLLCFPIPSFKTHLDVEVSEVMTLMLESYLFQILRSHLARVYSVSVTSIHHFGPFFPGDVTIQFVCDPNHVNALIERVFDAIEDLQLHGPSHRLLETSRTIYRKQKEAESRQPQEDDGLNNVFGTKVSTRDLDLLLDNKLAKALFNLLFPLNNYVQLVMLPESFVPPPKPPVVHPALISLGVLLLAGATMSFLRYKNASE